MEAITVQQGHGTWWLQDARARRFASLGVNHLQSDCWLAPYNRDFMVKRYGRDLVGPDGQFNPEGKALRRLVDDVKNDLLDLGFNTLGMHTYGIPVEFFANEFYYCVAIEHFPLGSRYQFGKQRFPDVFSESFAAALERRVRDVCLQHRQQERLIGYAYSDIPRWYFYAGETPDGEAIHPWVKDLLSLPDGAAGRQACRAVVGDEEVTSRAQSDAILRRIVERWYTLHATLIRRYDSMHLLLGDKLHSPHRLPRWFLPIIRDNVDILFIQWYTPVEQQAVTLEALHAATGKPILNGDSCFSCPKPPQQTRVKGYKVSSQAAVGKAYADYLKGAMRLPFMLGWHHCGLMEQWDGGKQHTWEINENGLFDPFGNPYVEITDPVRAANGMAETWHSQAGSADVRWPNNALLSDATSRARER